MIDLGTVKPGSTVRIPFSTFKGSDGSALTMTNFAAADILVYKDGSTTERASTSGYTATTDFDTKTGKQLAVIDLSDNTTADFWAAGSEYLVAIDAVTVDAVTTGGWIGRFRIGYPNAIHDTTIATLSSQTSFTLTAGPADNSALVGCVALIHDAASAVQRAIGVVSAYTGATLTVTLAADPAIFTMAAKDNISFFMPGNEKWMAQTVLTGRDIGASVLLSSGTGTGQLSITSGIAKVDVDTIKTNAVVNGGTVTFPTNATLASTTNITAAAGCAVSSIGANVITAAATAADFGAEIATAIWTDTTAGDFTVALSVGKSIMNGVSLGTGLTVASVSGAVGSVTGAVGSVTGNVGGNVTGSVGSVASGGISAASFAAGAIDAAAIAADAIGSSELAASAVSEIVTAIWTDTTASDFTTALSIGKSIMNGVSLGTGLTINAYTGNTPQTGDSYARIGAAGVGLTAVALADATSDAVIADAVWNAATATYGAAGSYGLLVETDLDATISSRLATSGYTAPSNLTAAQIATGVWTDTTAGDFTVALSVGKSIMNGVSLGTGLTVASVSGAVGSVTGAVGSVTGNVGGNVTGSVGSIATGGIAAASFAAGAIDASAIAANAIGASELATDAVSEIAAGVWDLATAGHTTAGTFGAAMNAAGSAGDPWATSLPGAYSAGSAGYIVGTNIDALISSRGTSTLTQTQVTGGAYALNSASFAFNAAVNNAIADQVWDELLAGHSAAGSTGSNLSQIQSALVAVPNGAVADAAATTTSFKTNLTDADNFWNDSRIIFTSGALTNQTRPILSFANTNGLITVSEALTSAPANGVTFQIIPDHIHPVSQIASGVWQDTTAGDFTVASSIGKSVMNGVALGTGLTVARCTLVDTTTTNTDMITAAGIRTAVGLASANLDTQIGTLATPTNITAASGVTLSNAGIDALFTRQLTESYNTDGTAPTVAQALMLIMQALTEGGITSTTWTIKKLDGSTTAATITLDSATTPTSKTRAT